MDARDRSVGEEARARLAAIVQSSDDAIIGTDREGGIVSWNRAAERLFGYSAAEAIGRPVTLIIPAERHGEGARNLQCVLRGEAIESYETVRCRKDGARIEVALTISPVRNERGEIVGAARIARDVTVRKRAEETLRESELLLRLAQRAANAGAWEIELQSDRFVASDEAMILYGIAPDTPLTHERALAAVHPDDRPLVEAALRRAKEDGEPFRLEMRVPRPDGSVRWILSQAELRDGLRGPRLVGLAQDITDRKQAEEQLRRNAETFDGLVKNSPFGLYIVDSHFRLLQISAGARSVFAGIEPLIGCDFAEILRIVWPEPFATEAIGRFRHTLATGEAYHAPDTTERRGNVDATESYDWKIERIMVPDGNFGVVCHFYDATRLRQAEQALEAADRRKDEFLAILAHELRNPLATLRNALYAMARSPAQETILSLGAMMQRQVDHLVRLVEDLLEVSRITTGKIDLRREPVALATVLDHAIEASRAPIDDAGHRLDVYLPAEPLTLVADPVRLTQVFVNLLNNAAKYTEMGGRIELSARRDGDEAVITVRDNGIGIPPEMLPNVFDLFTQVDRARHRSQGGLGIGLSLTRSLVELHGGSIHVSSEGSGTGTTFVVRLPLPTDGETVAPGLAAVSVPDAPRKRRRVLVADDDRDAAESLGLLLESIGADVEVVHDGAAAIAAAAARRPEIAMLDIGMPNMDGYEVARRMRQLEGGSPMLLVALTGWGQQRDIARARDAGFDRHLVKPAAFLEIQGLLDRE
ncbi:MAG: hybrid sensor histidine kinase/response regulator [Burkholderiaceae bacterium]